MAAYTLYVDIQAQALVQGYTNTLPATLPHPNVSDSIDLTIYFLNQTGVPSAPYSYANYTAKTVTALIGVLAGTPNFGTFTLSDASGTTGNIPFNSIPVSVQGYVASLPTWTAPTVTGKFAGPWRIVNGAFGALPVLTGDGTLLAPSSTVVITQQNAGTTTTPAINIVRLALNPIAKQTTWTIDGMTPWSFAGTLVPNPVTLEEMVGTLLSLPLSFSIQVTDETGMTTIANTVITFDNTLLPAGASYTPPVVPSGSFVMEQALGNGVSTVTFDYTSYGLTAVPSITPTLIKTDGSKSNLSIFPRTPTETGVVCDLSAPTDDTTYIAQILVIP